MRAGGWRGPGQGQVQKPESWTTPGSPLVCISWVLSSAAVTETPERGLKPESVCFSLVCVAPGCRAGGYPGSFPVASPPWVRPSSAWPRDSPRFPSHSPASSRFCHSPGIFPTQGWNLVSPLTVADTVFPTAPPGSPRKGEGGEKEKIPAPFTY